MAISVKQKFKAIGVILSVLLIIAVVVWLAAEKSTEPQFENKVDKLLFDTNNKSPKYIITLPDKTRRDFADKNADNNGEKADKPSKAHKGNLSEEDARLRELVNNTPNLSKLKDIADPLPLKYIETDSALSTAEGEMTLPKISEDGRKPWIEYAAPAKTVQPNFSRIAVVVKNLGLDRRATRAVVTKFPGEISLSFSPYGNENKELIAEARRHGHETYVDMYLSSRDFLRSDTGPVAMSMTSSQDENKQRLKKTVSSPSAIGGVIVNPGVADENNRSRLQELFAEIGNMGLLLIDATGENGVQDVPTTGLPRQKADIVINDGFTPENIRRSFLQAELLSQSKGTVVIAVEPKPVVLMELSRWINTFSPQYTYEEMKEKNITTIEKPFALIPLSEVVVE